MNRLSILSIIKKGGLIPPCIPFIEFFISELCLEVNFEIVEAAFEQFSHLFGQDSARVGACAGVADRVCGYFLEFIKKFFFVDYSVFVFFYAGWNAESLVHIVNVSDEGGCEFAVCLAGEMNVSCDFRIALVSFGFCGVELNYLG